MPKKSRKAARKEPDLANPRPIARMITNAAEGMMAEGMITLGRAT